jgi:DNA repair protein SbcD/Mre11
LQAIAASDISDAITRLIYKVKPEQIMLLDDRAIHSALSVAHTYSILPEVINQNSRVRLPELDRSTILDPISALKAYLGTREDLKADQADLLAATQAILSEISSEIGNEFESFSAQTEEQLSMVL